MNISIQELSCVFQNCNSTFGCIQRQTYNHTPHLIMMCSGTNIKQSGASLAPLVISCLSSKWIWDLRRRLQNICRRFFLLFYHKKSSFCSNWHLGRLKWNDRGSSRTPTSAPQCIAESHPALSSVTGLKAEVKNLLSRISAWLGGRCLGFNKCRLLQVFLFSWCCQ